jgi:hypothetical protein
MVDYILVAYKPTWHNAKIIYNINRSDEYNLKDRLLKVNNSKFRKIGQYRPHF